MIRRYPSRRYKISGRSILYAHSPHCTIRYIQIPVSSSDAAKQTKLTTKYCKPNLKAAKTTAAEYLGVSVSSIGVVGQTDHTSTAKHKDSICTEATCHTRGTKATTSGDAPEVPSPSLCDGDTVMEEKKIHLSTPCSRKVPPPRTPTSTTTVSVCDRKDPGRCHEYETHFNALLRCDVDYEVSQHERDNALYRGVSVTLVPKFSVKLREEHGTPITIQDLKFSEPPRMVRGKLPHVQMVWQPQVPL